MSELKSTLLICLCFFATSCAPKSDAGVVPVALNYVEVTYVKDSRTGLCFAIVDKNPQSYGDTAVLVDCEKVADYINH